MKYVWQNINTLVTITSQINDSGGSEKEKEGERIYANEIDLDDKPFSFLYLLSNRSLNIIIGDRKT